MVILNPTTLLNSLACILDDSFMYIQHLIKYSYIITYKPIVLPPYFELFYSWFPSFVFALNGTLKIVLNNKSIYLCLVSNFSGNAFICQGAAPEAKIGLLHKLYEHSFFLSVIKNAYYVLSTAFPVPKEMIMIFSL